MDASIDTSFDVRADDYQLHVHLWDKNDEKSNNNLSCNESNPHFDKVENKEGNKRDLELGHFICLSLMLTTLLFKMYFAERKRNDRQK